MATQTTPATAEAKKTKGPAKPPVPLFNRMTDNMKKGALGGKLTAEELDKLAALAGSLKVFVSAP